MASDEQADGNDPAVERILADFLDRVDAGEAPDRDALLAAHPGLREELQAFFAIHDQLVQNAGDGTAEEEPPGQEGITSDDNDAPTLLPDSQKAPPPVRKGVADTHPTAATESAPTGTVVRYFGDYELLREIARGGMGVVYEARQTSLNRTVALKMILAGQLAGEDDKKRFRAEAEAAANLDHPAIVPIYEVGEYEGQHYFSMGFVAGRSLADRLTEGPLSPRDAAEILRQVAQAVAFAHQRGVIHRDIKPGNILLDEFDTPRVTDFGLAKRVEGGSNLTASGQILGTPSYMPPEQASGKLAEIGPATDVYALGAVLYATLTGRPPFQADNPVDTILQVLEQEPVRPRQVNGKIPVDLETICLRCLEKEPGRRYDSADDFAEELRRFLDGEPIRARRISSAARAWRWCRRKPAVAASLAALALSLIAGTVVATSLAIIATDRAETAQRMTERAGEMADQARDQEQAAQREAERARRFWYVSDMNLAQQAWKQGDVVRVQQLLDRQRPEPGEVDLRGPEWFMLWRNCHNEVRSYPHSGPVVNLRFSPDGRHLAGVSREGAVVWDVSTGSMQGVADLVGVWTDLAFAGPDLVVVELSEGSGALRWRRCSLPDLSVRDEHQFPVDQDTAGMVTTVAVTNPSATHLLVFEDATVARLNERAERMEQAFEDEVSSPGFGLRAAGAMLREFGSLARPQSMFGITSKWINCQSMEEEASFDLDGYALHRLFAVSDGPSPKAAVSYHRTVRRSLSLIGGVSAELGVLLLDIESGEILGRIQLADMSMSIEASLDLRNFPTAVTLSRDGTHAAVGTSSGEVQVWRLDPVERLHRTVVTAGEITALALSDDGMRLAISGSDRMIRLRSTTDWADLGAIRGHRGYIRSLAFSPDGAYIAAADLLGDTKLWSWSESPQAAHASIPANGGAWTLLFTPDESYLYSWTEPTTIRDLLGMPKGFRSDLQVWDPATGDRSATGSERLAFLPTPESGFSAEAIGGPMPMMPQVFRSNNHRFVAVALQVDGASPELLEEFASVIEPGSGCVIVSDLVEGTRQVVPLNSRGLNKLVVSDDGRLLAYAQDLSAGRAAAVPLVSTMRLDTGEVMWTQQVAESTYSARSLQFSPDGGFVALGTRGDVGTQIWHVATGELQRDFQETFTDERSPGLQGLRSPAASVFALTERVDSRGYLAFGPDGRLAVSSNPGSVHIYRLTSGEWRLHARFAAHEKSITGLAFDPEGRLFTSGMSNRREIKIWDSRDGLQLYSMEGDAFVLGPRGGYLAVQDADRWRLWNLKPDGIEGPDSITRPAGAVGGP